MTEKQYRLEPRATNPYPLGRHVNHDERSKAFLAPRSAELTDVWWRRRRGPFDQGELGSCTGNACTGIMITYPGYRHYYTEPTAVAIYEAATRLDPYEGSYPPDDTGSDGLSVAKAAVQYRGSRVVGYTHALGLQAALEGLMHAPGMTGTRWDNNMFEPDENGFVWPGGGTAGGHEYEIVRVNVNEQWLMFCNSWGPSWGPLNGYFKMTWNTFSDLLDDDGDVTFLTKAA